MAFPIILPAHLRHYRAGPPGRLTAWWSPAQRLSSAGLKAFVERVYRPLLAVSLAYRYVTAAVFVSSPVLAFALIRSGRVRAPFFPPV